MECDSRVCLNLSRSTVGFYVTDAIRTHIETRFEYFIAYAQGDGGKGGVHAHRGPSNIMWGRANANHRMRWSGIDPHWGGIIPLHATEADEDIITQAQRKKSLTTCTVHSVRADGLLFKKRLTCSRQSPWVFPCFCFRIGYRQIRSRRD